MALDNAGPTWAMATPTFPYFLKENSKIWIYVLLDLRDCHPFLGISSSSTTETTCILRHTPTTWSPHHSVDIYVLYVLITSTKLRSYMHGCTSLMYLVSLYPTRWREAIFFQSLCGAWLDLSHWLYVRSIKPWICAIDVDATIIIAL